MSSVPTSSDLQRRVLGDLVGDELIDALLRLDDELGLSVTGPVPFSHAALAPMCTPPMSGLPSGAFMPLMVTR